jgi:predicted nucleic acid-binding protein
MTMPVVVSDTSPVRALAHLRLLNILPGLFGRVLIPPAVVTELASPPAGVVVVTTGDLPFADVKRPALDLLQLDLRFFISDPLRQSILRIAGE